MQNNSCLTRLNIQKTGPCPVLQPWFRIAGKYHTRVKRSTPIAVILFLVKACMKIRPEPAGPAHAGGSPLFLGLLQKSDKKFRVQLLQAFLSVGGFEQLPDPCTPI